MGFKAPPSWSWSPTGSVAGISGSATSSHTQRGSAQPLPDGLPADVREFIEKARRLPAWADAGKLERAFAFNEQRGLTYGLASGMMSTGIPHEARAVYDSQGGADMKDRIAKTAKLGYDVGTKDAFAPNGEMIATCVKTRMVHAAVRHLLPQSPHWIGKADEDVPISQWDEMVTWHSLPSTVMRHFRTWEIAIPDDEADAFLHSWQLTAHMLGIRDEYIPATWVDAEAQCREVLDPLLAPTPEGIDLAEILVNLAADVDAGLASRPFICSLTRYLLGHEFGDMMQLPRYPALDELIATSWPPFVAFREAALPLPLAPQGYWAFDEFLRRFVLRFLSEGKPISIELPDANRSF